MRRYPEFPLCPKPFESVNEAIQNGDVDSALANVLHSVVIDDDLRAYLFCRLSDVARRFVQEIPVEKLLTIHDSSRRNNQLKCD